MHNRFYHTSLYKFIYVSLVLLDVIGWTFVASGRGPLVPTKHRRGDPQSSELWFKVLFAFDIAICWLLVLDFTAKVLAFGRAHVFYYRREFFTMAALIPVAFHAFVQTLLACGANIPMGLEAHASRLPREIVLALLPADAHAAQTGVADLARQISYYVAPRRSFIGRRRGRGERVVLHVLLRKWFGDRLGDGLGDRIGDRFFVLRVLHGLIVGVLHGPERPVC